MADLAVAGARWRLSADRRARLDTVLLPWARRAGRRATHLLGVRWETMWETDLTEARQRLGIPETMPRKYT